MKQLICGSLNGLRIRQCLPQPYIRQTGKQDTWKAHQLGAVVQGLWSNPRARAAIDSRDRSRGCEGEDCGGKCLWRKARQPWKQGDTAESHVGGGSITITSLPLPASIDS